MIGSWLISHRAIDLMIVMCIGKIEVRKNHKFEIIIENILLLIITFKKYI
jgi:hypothetical protein